MTPRARALLVVCGLAAAAALPPVAAALRAGGPPHCALDGVLVDPLHRVVVDEADGARAALCSISCATAWLAREGAAPSSIRVVDEATGDELDVRAAWFVTSRVVAVAAADDRTHVFASEADARRHAQAYGGHVLVGDRRPFADLNGERTR